MDYFQSKRGERRCIFDASEEEYSFSEGAEGRGTRSVHQHFSQLYVARERFIEFVNQLGSHRTSEIREDILAHCQQSSKRDRAFQAFMSDETILKVMNLRIEKMIKNKRIKKNWSEEDVQILVWVISKYADSKGYSDIEKELDTQDWAMLASLIPGVTGESCMFKWLSLKKVNLATNNWSDEESDLLAKLVNQKGFEGKSKDSKDWKLISQRLYFLNNREDKIFRNAKQCREHWNCYLNPNLKKGPWKPEEDVQLLKCIKQNKGSKKWSQIVRYFDGRTENALKNRYTLIIEKQKKHNKHKSELEIIEEYLVRCYVDQFTVDIKPYSSQQEDREKSEVSFAIKQEMSEEPKQEDMKSQEEEEPAGLERAAESEAKVDQRASNRALAPITPVKVEKFLGLQQFMTMSMLTDRIDLGSIQIGTLSNGVFEKTEMDSEKSYSTPSPSKFCMKRYHSSML